MSSLCDRAWLRDDPETVLIQTHVWQWAPLPQFVRDLRMKTMPPEIRVSRSFLYLAWLRGQGRA